MAPRPLLNVEASQREDAEDHQSVVSSQVLIFKNELKPPTSIIVDEFPLNLEQVLPQFASFKFTPASPVAGLTVNPHGLVSSSLHGLSSVASQLIDVYASNSSVFGRIIVKIIRTAATEPNQQPQRRVLTINRTTPLFKCLLEIDESHCRIRPQSAGNEDLIVAVQNNCLTLMKMKPINKINNNESTNNFNFNINCDFDQEPKVIEIKFEESQVFSKFINQPSLIHQISNETKHLNLPLMPTSGKTWLVNQRGDLTMLPIRNNATDYQPFSIADLWLDRRDFGIISRPLGISHVPKAKQGEEQQTQLECSFVARRNVHLGGSIGELRNALTTTDANERRLQLLQSRYVALDWQSPFGDSLILLARPPTAKIGQVVVETLEFRHTRDNSTLICNITFEANSNDDNKDKAATRVVVFDKFIPRGVELVDQQIAKGSNVEVSLQPLNNDRFITPPNQFQLVVDEASSAASDAFGGADSNVNKRVMTTSCSLECNDLNGIEGTAVTVFWPAFLRTPQFAETVAFSIEDQSLNGNLFRINNATGQVTVVSNAEKEIERFQVNLNDKDDKKR